MSRKLIKSGLIVSIMTLVSRVLGLVRDVVVARLMGDGAAADVFFFANKIPNFLRRLFAEGAFAQAFIPVLTEVHNNDDKKELREFVAKVSGTLGGIVFLVSIPITSSICFFTFSVSAAGKSILLRTGIIS